MLFECCKVISLYDKKFIIMSNFKVDHSNCDIEPIHIPGQIQTHGFLIVVDDQLIIRFFSNNVCEFLPEASSNLLGTSLKSFELFFKNAHQFDFITQLINLGKANKSFDQTNPFQITIEEAQFHLVISTAANYFLLEFEPAISTGNDIDIQRMIGHTLTQMLADKRLNHLLNNTAKQVKNIIHYDRIMVYRFGEHGHGEVVAESKNDELESWLGLHYPASDIPKQARELYKLNLTRLIADVNVTPSKILTAADNNQSLDLTNAQLRAVSPMHIVYLKNMGVASSFSISIMYKNELWGLIACHNYSPKFIDYKSRESSKLLGQILSSALEFRQAEENQLVHQHFKNNFDHLSKSLQKSISIENALTSETITMLDVVNASGAILVFEKSIVKMGVTPDNEQVTDLLYWIKNNITVSLYHTTNLSEVYPGANIYRDIASGMMIFVLSKELEEYAIWFKPEIIKTITWAGNPEKRLETNKDGSVHLSPRNSFEAWTQNVSGNSNKWSAEEITSVLRLKEEITYAINQKASAIRVLNERLRLAYEELDTFSFTISHDLKNPITAIKGYLQILSMYDNVGKDQSDILLRITERTNKMNYMIDEILDYSRIGRSEIKYETISIKYLLDDVIKDLDQVYKMANVKITVGNTPDLRGDRVMMLQVFCNIISNAVKYAQFKNPAIIHIEGIADDSNICYSIKDNGLGIAVDDLSKIFELFKRMNNVKELEGSGVGLAIVKRIVEKHKGKVWVESELGKGSTFFVSFNK